MDISNFLYCDLETYGTENLFKAGPHRYAESAEILLLAYALGDEPPIVLDFTEPGFDFEKKQWRFNLALADGEHTTVWHNGAKFDRIILKHVLGIDIPMERLHDTMVQAYSHGLPGSLAILSEIFKLDEDEAKMKEGKRLIQQFCKPRPKNHKLKRATRETHPEDWKLFIEYAKRDIISMRKLHQKMPMWNMNLPTEKALWHLDEKINNRGFKVDIEFAKKAIAAAEKAKISKNDRVDSLTFGCVEKGTQREALLEYVNDSYGAGLDNLQASTIERMLLLPDLHPDLRELLTLRRAVSGTSVSKYPSLLGAVSSDGRLRGTLQFCGAARTGRWAGRLFQPHNLPRPTLDQETIDEGIAAILGDYDDLIVEDVLELAQSAVRGCIVASEGKKLVVSDLSNIEGRVAAWFAGEDWKLKAFYDFDKGEGEDLYKLAYAHSFDISPEDVDKDQRQIGKVMELALGYQGGVGAFLTFVDTYKLDLEELVTAAYPLLSKRIKAESNSHWGFSLKEKRTYDLDQRTFVTCDSLKRMWREAHPKITAYWGEINNAAVSAVMREGKVFEAGRLKFYRKGKWLRMVLPSGRALCYASPSLKEGALRYYSINPFNKKWQRTASYGGKLFENACQAVARDVMAANMPAIEEAGYEIILSVHDELITEAPERGQIGRVLTNRKGENHDSTPKGWYNLDSIMYNEVHLSQLLATNPEWAEGLPLAAGGFEAYRYRKG